MTELRPKRRSAIGRRAAAPPARTSSRTFVACAALAALAALLAGCSGSLLPKPPTPPTRFTLDVPGAAAAARQAAAGAPVLVVAVPRAAPGFDSSRMIYLRRPQELEAYASNEWVDTPARMLAPLLVQTLQGSGAFSAVLLAPSAASGAWRLETELIRLQQDFGNQPSQVRLTLRAVLVKTADRQVIAWREFDETVPAPTDDQAGGAAAAHQASQRVLAALAAFCAAQAPNTTPRGPASPAAR
jgi:cholesterol transport system auxiliary component